VRLFERQAAERIEREERMWAITLTEIARAPLEHGSRVTREGRRSRSRSCLSRTLVAPVPLEADDHRQTKCPPEPGGRISVRVMAHIRSSRSIARRPGASNSLTFSALPGLVPVVRQHAFGHSLRALDLGLVPSPPVRELRGRQHVVREGATRRAARCLASPAMQSIARGTSAGLAPRAESDLLGQYVRGPPGRGFPSRHVIRCRPPSHSICAVTGGSGSYQPRDAGFRCVPTSPGRAHGSVLYAYGRAQAGAG